jgi:hypothetical protein
MFYDRLLGHVYFCSLSFDNSGVELAIISAGVQTKDEAVAAGWSFKCKHTARYTSDFFNQALAASTGPRHFGLY